MVVFLTQNSLLSTKLCKSENYLNTSCVFAVFLDVRYETKGTFTPGTLDNARSYREFNGYIIVAKNSTMELTISGTLRSRIYVVVLSSFAVIFEYCNIRSYSTIE